MRDSRRILPKAIGFTYAHRVFTFLLTSFSYPFLIRHLPIAELALWTVATSAIGFFQLVADGGVPSALAVQVARLRSADMAGAKTIVVAWLRAQAIVVLVGVLAAAAAAWMLSRTSSALHVPMPMALVLIAGACISVIGAFLKAILRASLRFGAHAVVDAAESIVRGAGWLLVGSLTPWAISLAVAHVVQLAIGCMVGVLFVGAILSKAPSSGAEDKPELSLRGILRQSYSFALIGLLTSGSLQLPILLIARLKSAAEAAVVGVLFNVLNLVNGPIMVVGNVIGAKAFEIVYGDEQGGAHLWAQMWRICAVYMIVISAYFCLAPWIASMMVPTYPGAIAQFRIFTVILAFNAVAAIFVAPVDYLGQAKRRVRLMLWAGAIQVAGVGISVALPFDNAHLWAMTASYVALVAGYVRLARQCVSGPLQPARVPFSAVAVGCACGVGAIASLALESGVQPGQGLASLPAWLAVASPVLLVVAATAALLPSVRAEFHPKRLLRLEAQ